MRTLFAASLAVAALALASCSNADDTADTPAADAEAGTAAAPVQDTSSAQSTVLNANTATAEQLAGAPGMTTELAEAIIAGRPYSGAAGFKAKLTETLDEAAATKVLEGVFVPVNLNSASKADIAAIPGMTEKMIHEFEEYRPYDDMAEFDREIGKYVDAAEVARFRNYVTL